MQFNHSHQHEEIEQPRERTRPADYEILEVAHLPGRSVVVILAHVGTPFTGQRLGIRGSNARWTVSGISFAPLEAIAATRWGLLLRPRGAAPELTPHMHLLTA